LNNQLILLEKKIAFSKLPQIIRNDDICYLLSKDYLSYLRLNNGLPGECEVFNLNGQFNKEINRLRTDYLDLFTGLSKKYSSKEWWSSHIASRNSASIPLQLNITYLFCAKNIIYNITESPNQKRIIFIADSQALLESIAVFGEKKNFSIIYLKKRTSKIINNFKLLLLYAARIGLFAWSSCKKWILAATILKPISFANSVKKKRILIRSWITKGTLNKDGLYIDRNFGVLPKLYKTKGYEIIMLPMFFNLDKPLKDIYKLMKQQNVSFLTQARYLELIDYFNALHIAYKQITISLKNIYLDGVDVALLFREIQLQLGFSPGTMELNLFYPFLKRLKRLSVEIDRFYYPFENNVPEKPFIMGCNKYYPKSEIIAYQHSVWFNNQLGEFLGDGESAYHPIADKIITCGPIFLKVLREANFPNDIIFPGPNLRFSSVHKKPSILSRKIKRPNILLPLTMIDDLAYDLLHKVKLISKYLPELFIYIRRHPSLNFNELGEFLNEIKMDNFEYADEGNIKDWLENIDIVLSTGCSISMVETVVSGVPLIRIEPDNNFFLDPLAWTNYPIKPINTIEEILSTIKYLLGMNNEDKNKLQAVGKNILLEYFSEANDKNIEIFF